MANDKKLKEENFANYMPNNITDCLTCAQLELEKGRLLMDLLVQDCPFDVEPDRAILMWNYKQMAVFLDYASSSMYEIDRYLKHATELEGGGANHAQA